MKLFSKFIRSALLLAAVASALNVGTATATYCEDEKYWPGTSVWMAFNATVNGNLIAIDPPLKPCASSESDDVCVDLFTKSASADWISSLPGGYAYPVFTQDDDSKVCFLHAMTEFDAFRDSGECDQGSISSFGVAVTSDAEIAAALAFAAKNQLRVVIENTGHDLQGRSVGSKYALMIWLNDYKKVEIKTDYKACTSDAAAPAVIATGGVRWGDVYSVVKAANYHVVGAASRTVGAVGGWVQGGGHSFSSPAFGLGVDNVLKFTVVLPNGNVVDASSCTNPDLFWALRGGGGASFGIVTSAAYKLYSKQVVTDYEFDFTPKTDAGCTALLTNLLTWVADVSTKANDVVVGGYPVLYGEDLGGKLSGRLVINGTIAQAQALLAPFQTKLDAQVANTEMDASVSTLTEKTSFLDWFDFATTESEFEVVGTLSNSVSRLIPMFMCEKPTDLVKVLVDYAKAYPLFAGKLKIVAGGAVSTADTASAKTSVSPSWRDSCVRLVVTDLAQSVVRISPDDVFASTKDEATTKVKAVSDMGVALRDVVGADRGAYFAESDYIETNWQKVFWGQANYDKLLVAKMKYDPMSILSCHHCVGEVFATPDGSSGSPPFSTTTNTTTEVATTNSTGTDTNTTATSTNITTTTPSPSPTTATSSAAGGFTFSMLFVTQVVLLGSWVFFRNQ